QRRAESAVRFEMDTGFGAEHTHGKRGELGEHQLEHRATAPHGGTEGNRGNGFLGDRRIHDAAAVLVVLPQPLEGLERTAHRADVLPYHEDAFVALKLLAQALHDRFDKSEAWHQIISFTLQTRSVHR